MPKVGSRVSVKKGKHKSVKGRIAHPPPIAHPQERHLTFVRLDGIDKGGFCGSGVFLYRKDKLEELTVLDELAEV